MPLRAVPEVETGRLPIAPASCMFLTRNINSRTTQGPMAEAAVKLVSEAARASAGQPARRTDLMRYAVAPASVAVALALRALLAPVLDGEAPYLLFVPAVLAASWLGGLGPGIVATVLGVLLGFLF